MDVMTPIKFNGMIATRTNSKIEIRTAESERKLLHRIDSTNATKIDYVSQRAQ